MNTAVSATGMQVKARSEGGIVIATVAYDETAKTFSDPDEASYAQEATASLASATIYPTSTPKGSFEWWHATSSSVNSHAATSSYEKLDESGNNALAGQSVYYLLNKFKVKTLDDSTQSLYVQSITVTGGANSVNLNKSLRVAVKVGTGSIFVFAPNYGSTTDVTKLKFYNGTVATAYAAGEIKCGTTGLGTLVASDITSTASDILVYVYYEGEDENCKSVNATKIDSLTVEIQFGTSAS